MSKLTKEINKISLAVIGISGRLVFYALVLTVLLWCWGSEKRMNLATTFFTPREWKRSRGRKRL